MLPGTLSTPPPPAQISTDSGTRGGCYTHIQTQDTPTHAHASITPIAAIPRHYSHETTRIPPQIWRAKNASEKLASSKPLKRTKPTVGTATTKKKGERPTKETTAAAAAAAATETAADDAAANTVEGAAMAASKASPGRTSVGEDGSGLFELAYAIPHDGGGVVKCRWAPESGSDGGAAARGIGGGAAVGGQSGAETLGLLAAIFLDGSLR